MYRSMHLRHLEEAEQHISRGEQQVSAQERRIEDLERGWAQRDFGPLALGNISPHSNSIRRAPRSNAESAKPTGLRPVGPAVRRVFRRNDLS